MPESRPAPTSGWLHVREIDELTEWSSEVGLAGAEGLPERVLRRAGAVLADDLAAMVAAEDEPEVREVAVLAERRGQGRESGIVPTGARAQREWAAVANAVAANWSELDEGYRPATCHGGLYSVPAAVAEVEATGGSVGEALTAIVAGYEVSTRVARAYVTPKPPRLHPHATLSPVGAAAAVAAARRMDGLAAGSAVRAAASLSLTGPFPHAAEGALIRNGWPAAGALLGFNAVDFATAGLAGGADAVAEVFGDAQGGRPRPGELTSGLGQRYAVEDGYHKLYACCQYTHAAVEAALRLSRKRPARDITAVKVQTHPLALALDGAVPANTLAGKFSVPHAVAAALATGSPAADTFSSTMLRDPEVSAIRARVELGPYTPAPEPPHDRPARLTVTYADGSTATAEVLSAIGSPDRPLDASRLLDKIGDIGGVRRPRLAEVLGSLIDGGVDLHEPLTDLLGAALVRKD